MKIFISQRMNGLSVEGIKRDRQCVLDYFGPDHEYIQNYIHMNAPSDAGRLWHLGESIKQMAEADIIVFINDWYNANGCQIEMEICRKYGLNAVVLEIDKTGNAYGVKIA